MTELELKIIEVVKKHPLGIKASEIAEILSTDKTTVNSCIYKSLSGTKLIVDENYKWYAPVTKVLRKTTSAKEEWPLNTGKKWTDEEKIQLMEEYMEGIPMAIIAEVHERTELAIAMMVTEVINSEKEYSNENE